MRLGLDVAQHHLSWDELAGRVARAEMLGFDGAWVFDHFTALYGDPAGPCMEGWSLLAALAARTSRIRLGTLVTGITYRHPSVLTAQAVTVDHVSGGRLDLGVGAAWHSGEHRRLGIAFPPTRERFRRLEEAVEVMRLLMTRDGFSYEGEHLRLDGAYYNPKPVQRPHPPIWIGGTGPKRTLPLVGRWADVWHGFGGPEELAARSRLVDEHARASGRDPASIARASSLSISADWSTVLTNAERLARAGFSYLVVGWPSEGEHRVEEFAEQVMSDVRAL